MNLFHWEMQLGHNNDEMQLGHYNDEMQLGHYNNNMYNFILFTSFLKVLL